MRSINVAIPIADTWPTRNELAARNAVIDELDAIGIGTCSGAGGGMGEMDFSYRVADESNARIAIDEVMQKLLPNSKYTVTSLDK